MTSDVTVVIPVYDRPQLADEAIASALANTPPPQIIVVDDHGARPFTARTMAWAEAGTLRIVGDRNLGLPAARNLGARSVTTPYLLFLDDDDRLAPDALSTLRAALEASPSASAAGGGRRGFEGSVVEETIRWPSDLSAGIAAAVTECPFSTPGQVMIRREAFEAVGGFVVEVPLAEDWDLWVRLLTVGPILTPPVHAVDYRRHSGSMSATTRVAHQSMTLCHHYRLHPPSPAVTAALDMMVASVVDTFLAKVLWQGARHVRKGNFSGAMREWAMARRLIGHAMTSPRGRAALREVRRTFFRPTLRARPTPAPTPL